MASSRTCDQCGKPLPPEGRFCSHCGSLSGSAEAADGGASARLGPWERILERLRTVTAGRYDVQRLLGWGGMAGVYLAEELRLKRRVAIKVIAPGLLMDPSQIERFEQEARTTAQLNHPNIVTIFEVDEREDLHYFTMTYVPGRALSQVMAEAASPLPVDVVRAWVRQVSGALSYAHQRGVVHRDIKPGNILLDEHGSALVGDFGIAKVAEEPGLTRTGMLVGTPAYMSPEQCTTGKVTGASDQYSLGAVAYQLIAGEPPFAGTTIQVIQAHVNDPPRDVRELRPECPDDLAEVVMRMLAKDPADRWPSLYDAVDAVGGGTLRHDDPVRHVMAQLSSWTHAVRIREDGAASGAAGADVAASTLPVGDTRRFHADALDYRGNVLPGRKVTWSVEPAGAATVGSDGSVTGVLEGPATLVATSGRVHADWGLAIGASDVEVAPVPAPPEGASGDPAPTPGPPPPVAGSEEDVAVADEPDSATDLIEGEAVAAAVSEPADSGAPDPSPPTAPPTSPSGSVPRPAPETAGTESDPDGSASRRPLFAGLGVAAVAVIAVVFALSGGGPGDEPAERSDDEVVQAPASEEPDPVVDPPPVDDDPDAASDDDPAPLPGVVRVAGSFPAGARVRVTGEGVDREGAPGDLALEAGAYRLELRADGFRTASTSWTVAAGDTSEWRPSLVRVSEDPPPPPPPGRIRVLGELPPGTVVRVRGNGIDRRGLDFELPPGAYSLQASASGYRTVSTDMTVLSGATREWRPSLPLIPVTPPPADERDSVRSLPETPTTADPPADTEESAGARAAGISGAIRAFADALQSRDANRLRAAYPTVSQNWLQFIASDAIRNLRVDASGMVVPPDGERVEVPFVLRLDYDSGAPSPGARPYRATVERQDGAWVMVDLQSGG